MEDRLTIHYQEKENLGFLDEQSLGGLNPTIAGGVSFYGLKRNEIIDTDFIANRIDLRINPFKNIYLYSGVDILLLNYPKKLFNSNHEDSVFDVKGEARKSLLGYGLGLGFDSIFGPVRLNSSIRQGGELQFFFSIGYIVDRKRY